MPRRKSKLTEEQRSKATTMAAHGFRHEQIALVLDIPPETLEKQMSKELRRAPILAHLRIRQTLYKAAISEQDTRATIYADKVWDGIGAGQNKPEGQPVLPPQIIIRTDSPEMKIADAGQNA
jgi:hypothetical protein